MRARYPVDVSALRALRAQRFVDRISFFFDDTAPTEIYTLSLHDALPISGVRRARRAHSFACRFLVQGIGLLPQDRKSTRLNSSHVEISYAVFCLKKKIRSNPLPPRT